MLKPRWALVRPQKLLLSQWLCPACQLRLQWPYRQASSINQTPEPSIPKPESSSLEAKAPPNEDFTPKPLSRPLGQSTHPRSGENSGIDHRTWRQRRDDFFNYEKHLERRKELTRKVAKPYFREWTNMRHHRGKTFVSPAKPFKADVSLYFPNMQGYTLASPSAISDTTKILSGKTSIVSVFSGKWAEDQTLTFVGEDKNSRLAEEVERLKGDGLQRVWINIEEDWMKAVLVRLFLGTVRKRLDREEWARHFVVRRGVEEDVKLSIGMANGKVGYVYLIDGDCKIRWAGSGDAAEEEKESLVRVVRRLVEKAKERTKILSEGMKMEKTLKGLRR